MPSPLHRLFTMESTSPVPSAWSQDRTSAPQGPASQPHVSHRSTLLVPFDWPSFAWASLPNPWSFFPSTLATIQTFHHLSWASSHVLCSSGPTFSSAAPVSAVSSLCDYSFHWHYLHSSWPSHCCLSPLRMPCHHAASTTPYCSSFFLAPTWFMTQPFVLLTRWTWLGCHLADDCGAYLRLRLPKSVSQVAAKPSSFSCLSLG